MAVTALAALTAASPGEITLDDSFGDPLPAETYTLVQQPSGKWRITMLPVADPGVYDGGLPVRILASGPHGPANTVESFVHAGNYAVDLIVTDADITAIEFMDATGEGFLNAVIQLPTSIGPALPAPATAEFRLKAHRFSSIWSQDGGRISAGICTVPYSGAANPGQVISNVLVDSGDLVTPVRCDHGAIGSIHVRAGNILDPGTGGPAAFYAAGGINEIDAFVGDIIGLRIEAGTNPANGVTMLHAGRDILNAQFGSASSPTMMPDLIHAGRDLSGEFNIADVGTRVRADRDLLGTLRFGSPTHPSSSVSRFQKVRIGNDFAASAVIWVPRPDPQNNTGGLPFDIVINANHRTLNPTSGKWLGQILYMKLPTECPDPQVPCWAALVAPSGPQTPEYSRTVAAVGGGSVGVLPYRLHGSQTQVKFRDTVDGTETAIGEPVDGAVNQLVGKPVRPNHPERVGALFRWYGAVHPKFAAGTPPPLRNYLKLQRRVFPGPQGEEESGWQDITSALEFPNVGRGPTWKFGETDERLTQMGGEVLPPGEVFPVFTEFTRGAIMFLNGYQYRFIPNRTELGSSEVLRTLRCTVQPDVVGGESSAPSLGTDQFIFLVGNGCPSDIDGSGETNTSDLTIFLSNFGKSNPAGIAGDFNGDDYVSTADLVILLSRFGQVCAGGGPNTIVAGPPAPGGGLSPGIASRQELGALSAPNASNMASAMPTPPGPVIAALGFSSAEAFEAYIDTLSDAELKVYLVLVLQVAHSLEAPAP